LSAGLRPRAPVKEKPGAVSPLRFFFAPERCAGYGSVPYMVGRERLLVMMRALQLKKVGHANPTVRPRGNGLGVRE
jgi:hypothetical protein